MKRSFLLSLVIITGACALSATQAVLADGRHHYRHGYHGHHHRHHNYWSPSVVIGVPLFYHHDYYRDYPRSRTVIIERDRRSTIGSGPPPAQYWYYCNSADAYYPYVERCPEGWQEVPAEPADVR